MVETKLLVAPVMAEPTPLSHSQGMPRRTTNPAPRMYAAPITLAAIRPIGGAGFFVSGDG